MTALIVFASTYALSLCTDFLKTIIEIWINFRRTPHHMRVGLGPKSVCFIIPCHNSADVIYDTLLSLPKEYAVYCMVNACTDRTLQRVGFLSVTMGRTIRYEHILEPGKMNAVMHGVLLAKAQGFTHFVLIDDDVKWPKGQIPRVAGYNVPATGLPVLPMQPVSSIIEVGQCIEYMYMVVSKRAQGILGNTIMASGAAGIYRIDTFLEVLKHHDGEHIGDDLQSAHIHHSKGYQIDFNPDIVIQTHPPRGLVDWWKQRAKRWEISPIYNLKWILTTIFGKATLGWWIRWIASYRIFVGVNDLARVISFAYVVQHFPRTLVGVWAIAYVCFIVKGITYWKFYPQYRYRPTSLLVKGILTYPLYSALMWVSRVWAIPMGIKKHFNRKRGGIYVETINSGSTIVLPAGTDSGVAGLSPSDPGET